MCAFVLFDIQAESPFLFTFVPHRHTGMVSTAAAQMYTGRPVACLDFYKTCEDTARVVAEISAAVISRVSVPVQSSGDVLPPMLPDVDVQSSVADFDSLLLVSLCASLSVRLSVCPSVDPGLKAHNRPQS
jgi:hypothetical protein